MNDTNTKYNELENQVLALLEKGKTSANIATLLVTMDEIESVPLAKDFVALVAKKHNIKLTKPVSMAQQLKDWYIAEGLDALSLTKEEIQAKVLSIGMSGGSVKYYVGMYVAASEIAKDLVKLSKEQA